MQKLTVITPTFNVEISAEHERDIFKKAAFWLSLPTICPICAATLVPNFRTPKGFEYFELKCNGKPTSHSIALGISNDANKDLYYDSKKQWYAHTDGDPADSRRDQDQAAPSVTPNTTSPPAVTPNTAPAADVGLKNQLLKLIKECKGVGIYSRINPADVGAMEVEQLTQQIERLGTELLQKGATN